MRGSSTEFVWLALKTRSTRLSIRVPRCVLRSRFPRMKRIFDARIGKINSSESSEFSEFFQF